jgi:hypothetical protein
MLIQVILLGLKVHELSTKRMNIETESGNEIS